MRQNKFAYLSLIMAIISIGLLCLILFTIPSTVKAGDEFTLPPSFMFNVLQLLTIIGIFMIILSIYKKEPISWITYVGGIINIFLFFIFWING